MGKILLTISYDCYEMMYVNKTLSTLGTQYSIDFGYYYYNLDLIGLL